ncbi:MarR family winged helix-turn-helix transcriptional regulator [Streptomyces endophyticus]|uniref:MarR family winged helix-turn-helix transcriptional regulator n=1 Tax=Streptomyces endophyticus TaxID=714166 RepID=A0ABU6F4F1_9ACTN|nr:MarR family winged helix-turn-helix transcriptional regulator [Streptomyces endophyticus]MEB8338876.1 MarR family winged helix-turn-helix transcriptional regulator [Streptomyces endophyticus]
MQQPASPPLGLQLSQAARTVSRAFEEALEEADGSLPVWLILLNLKTGRPANQRRLAEAVGVRDATLTHHLNAMDKRGLITRRRDTTNRRIHVVELTEAGEAAFTRMRKAAATFDRGLNTGLSDADRAELSRLLQHLARNVGTERTGA